MFLAGHITRNAVECEECGTAFKRKPRAPQTRFCSPKCRQAAFRRKPLTTSALIRRAEDAVARGVRRDLRFRQLNRDRALTFDPVYSGPIREGVPVLDSFQIPSRKELREAVAKEL